MIFKDKVRKPIEGFFKIECFDKNDKLVDSFEKKNMIMFTSKQSVANSMHNPATSVYINKISLGNDGTISGNTMAPKTFTYDILDLFVGPSPVLPKERLDIDIVPGLNQNPIGTIMTNTNIVNTSSIEYEITLNEDDANGSGIVGWSEAALFTSNGDIFAMRTFPAKIKDSTTKLKITWKIVF